MTEQVPDLIHEIVGYRVFKAYGTRLMSQHVPYAWSTVAGAVEVAGCKHDLFPFPSPHLDVVHVSPDWRCKCGIYAYYSPHGGLHDRMRIERLEQMTKFSNAYVIGLISCWGICIPHVDGFRSQYARVCVLVGDAGAAVADRLGVSLLDSVLDMIDVAPEFGLPYPDQLRPDSSETERPRLLLPSKTVPPAQLRRQNT
jgi:hypothetical protein